MEVSSLWSLMFNLFVELLFVSDRTSPCNLRICFSNVYYVLRTVKALKSTEISKVITHIIARLFLKLVCCHI